MATLTPSPAAKSGLFKRKMLDSEDKVAICKAYVFLSENTKVVVTGGVRSAVSTMMGVSVSTVKRVWKEFCTTGELCGPKPKGRPPTVLSDVDIADLREFVREENRAGRPVSMSRLKKHLLDWEKNVSSRTLLRYVDDMGLKYGRGRVRHGLHESAACVALRAEYLRRLRENRDASDMPIRPEVVLDESFCNLHHVRDTTWYVDGDFVSRPSGKGPRFCIVGAGVYKRHGRSLQAGWVPDSFVMWAANTKGTGAKRGLAVMAGEDDEVDYHGNFNAQLFQKWFKKLCATLHRLHGSCVIIMDGAKYHKAVVERAPTKSSNKTAMTSWLTKHGIPFTPACTRAELYEIILEHKKDIVRYVVFDIAHANGNHTVLFTPPYHCELQPIEMIWGCLKNPVAHSPAATMPMLKGKLLEAKDNITQEMWLASRRKVVVQEKKYWARLDEDLEDAESDDSDFDSSDSSDDDDEDDV